MISVAVEQIREMMDIKPNIRNVSVVGQLGHGKTVLFDYLISKSGIISEKMAGKVRFMDTRQDEQEQCLTIKSTAVSLVYEKKKEDEIPVDADGRAFLLNLIDTPGHVQFASEVSAALRVTDGALVVVSCVEGFGVQTETALRQALAERVKPVVMLSKVDRALLDLQLAPEELYQRFVKEIESVNGVIAAYEDELLGRVQVSPEAGTVAFGSGLQGWGFTLNHFAKLYGSKFGVKPEKLVTRLWGDKFWDPKRKKWDKKPTDQKNKPLQRGFCQFVLDPIYQLFRVIMSGDHEKSLKLIQKVGVQLRGKEKEETVTGKALLQTVMRKFLPAADALLEMLVLHLPSPVTAQRYRVKNLYEGPMEDECAKGIASCDPKAPLMVYVSKMVPAPDKGRFYSFGRVFSGTLKGGQKVRIMGPDYTPGKKKGLFIKPIPRVVVMMGNYVEKVSDCPCGSIIGIIGIDKYLLKTGTISTSEEAYSIKAMKFSVSPVACVAVEPKNASDLPKLIEGFRRLCRSDQCVKAFTEDSGQHIVAGAGEFHLQVCLKDFEENYCQGVPLTKSKPFVSYRETVTKESSQMCITKSPNKHNILFVKAEPLHIDLCIEIENGDVGSKQRSKIRSRYLAEKYDWDLGYARKIWAFGPESVGVNILVNQTKGVKYLKKIKDSIVAAFEWATQAGALCEENMRGIRFNLHDAKIPHRALSRGGGQIISTARRSFYASQLSAMPTLMEPIYLCEIQCLESAIGSIKDILSQRRGQLISVENSSRSPIHTIKSYLPVIESFGSTEAIRSKTNAKQLPQYVFHHWETMQGEYFEENGILSDTIKENRLRKGLEATIPPLEKYTDQL
ncbi:eukaryotic translation elongation factor 2a tandem duplicate 1-related [Anaeramoeba flamelloides]|uniref:Eukaryotic translation elongation factor 2a tandem duplicate 1-related n=1 Tax=Anaeramoeba flamelloides TaxID=1746091 RepID=A0AAV7YC11_9EUKA|nr:eukaryotic translation elongation factor 2a tandem duplicate 1-related [Anaeramoeba flamelloides]